MQVFTNNKNKMIELIFIIGIVLIFSIGLYLKKSTQDFIDYKNKAYLNTINKIKPKIKK
mgnify:CR=1 FL=1